MYDMKIIDYKLEVNTESTKHNLPSFIQIIIPDRYLCLLWDSTIVFRQRLC
jgi:hypothetical protein